MGSSDGAVGFLAEALENKSLSLAIGMSGDVITCEILEDLLPEALGVGMLSSGSCFDIARN